MNLTKGFIYAIYWNIIFTYYMLKTSEKSVNIEKISKYRYKIIVQEV